MDHWLVQSIIGNSLWLILGLVGAAALPSPRCARTWLSSARAERIRSVIRIPRSSNA